MTGNSRRFYRRPIVFIPAIILAVPALWFAWWLGSPLVIDKTVVEAFPAVTAPPDARPAPGADLPTVSGPAPGVTEGSAPGREAAPRVTASSAAPVASAAGTAAPAAPSPTAAEPTVLLAGTFKDADSRHRGSGDAAIYELADGSLVLRVENLDVTNGPDLHVFLVPVADVTESGDVMAEGYLDLGALKGNKGDQNYPIIGDVDLGKDWTVVVYCVPFHVVFSTAPLTAA